MPNHVTNRVTITAQSLFDEWQCLQAVTDDQGRFDFNKLIPMSESLHVEAASKDVEIAKGREGGAPYNAEHVEVMRKNLEDTGYAYWYDFAVREWGTKWNSYSHKNEPGELAVNDDARVLADELLAQGHPEAEAFALAVHRGELRRAGVLVFETAWSCPRPVYEEMARRFPNVKVVVEYADEDIGHNCGTLTFESGALVSAVCPEGDQADAFAYRVTGRSPEEDEEDDAA